RLRAADTGSISDSTGDQAYRRPPPPLVQGPPATSRGAAQASRLQSGGGSHMSIVDDDTEADDDDDFAPQPVVSRGASSASMADTVETEESNACPICLEGWTLSGAHKLASLKCGHLFGRSCIRKWLTQKSSHHVAKPMGRGACPECKQPAAVRDIRVLFARSVTAVDGVRVEELTKENRRLAQELGAARSEVAEFTIKYRQMHNEVARLRGELDAAFKERQWMALENENLARRIAALKPRDPGDPELPDEPEHLLPDEPDLVPDDVYTPRMRLRATVPVAVDGGSSSRVLAFDPHSAVIYASHSQPFTMAIVDVHNAARAPLLIAPHLHSLDIRDAQVSPHAAGTRYLLTASHDKSAALTALGSGGARMAPKLAARLKLNAPAWSCAWHPADANVCYVGMASSAVLAFDLRNPATPLHAWSGVRDRACLPANPAARDVGYSQIHSIAALPAEASGEECRLVVANSHYVYALPTTPGAPWTQLTGAEDGMRRACYALSYDAHLRCVAASFRTTVDDAPCTVHDLYKVRVDGGALDWCLMQRIPTKSPQNKLARSAVFSYTPTARRRQGVFCAVVEASRSVNVWSVGESSSETTVPLSLADVAAPEDIVDVRGWQWGTSDTMFATLTNSTMRIYDVR
ncbi:RING finger and WD repeat domain-containing protein 3, partial [Coemansia furcata]